MRDRTPADAGIIYISFGDIYRRLTAVSISGLRRSGYTGPVRVLTDRGGWGEDASGCEIVLVKDTGGGFGTRYYKTRLNQYGFDQTLFLDADTLPVSSLNDLWRQLRLAPVCMARDLHPNVGHLIARSTTGSVGWQGWTPCQYSPERRLAEYECMKSLNLLRHTFYNSGVLLFRRGADTDQLFECWSEEWERFRDADQLALVRAIARCNIRIHTLSPRWNARCKGSFTVEEAQIRGLRILHLRPGSDMPLPPAKPVSRDGALLTHLRRRLQFRIARLKFIAVSGAVRLKRRLKTRR